MSNNDESLFWDWKEEVVSYIEDIESVSSDKADQLIESHTKLLKQTFLAGKRSKDVALKIIQLETASIDD